MAKSKPKIGGDPNSPWQNRIVGYEYIPAGQLTANPLNWRIHPGGQQQALEGVIDSVGWVQNVIVNKRTGNMIDGHLRATLALRRGEETPVPVTIVDLSEEEEAVILASLDPLAAMAGTDKAKLDELLHAAQSDNEKVQSLLANIAEQSGLQYGAPPPDDPGAQIDRAEELRVKWGVESGQLWRIPSLATPGAEHRIICGDCTDAAVVARVMGGEKAVLLSTDPPYGVDFEGAKYNPRAKEWGGIDGDKRQGSSLTDWLSSCLRLWLEFCTEDLAVYLWTAAMQEGAAAAAAAAGIHIQSQIIWNKNTLVLGQADYQWKHENCWYGFLKGKHHRWFGGRSQTTVWDISKIANSAYMHPMQKPVEIYEKAIENHTQPGEICADPFSGSGTQFIACERLARRCLGAEISPAYVAVALERLAGLGLKPEIVK